MKHAFHYVLITVLALTFVTMLILLIPAIQSKVSENVILMVTTFGSALAIFAIAYSHFFGRK